MTQGEDRDSRAALGLSVKTGRAIAIALAGTAQSPRFLARSELQLCDRKVFATIQPYHAALKVSEAEGEAIVERARKTVVEIATRSVRDFAEEVSKSGYMLAGVGLVISTDHDPGPLKRSHIRAHALEGRFFWKALEQATDAIGIPHLYILEHDAFDSASRALGRKADHLKDAIAEIGRAAGRPWSADEKCAALAAWIALARR